jgi:hypothetical protein
LSELKVWECEVCGAAVPVAYVADGFQPKLLRPELPESCKLKEHSFGNECIVLRQINLARDLLAEKQK